MNAATGLVAIAVAFAALFWHTFRGLYPVWLNDPSYGHSGAVALAILGFIGYRANKYAIPEATPSRAGSSPAAQFVVGVLGAWTASLFASLLVWQALALWVKSGDQIVASLAAVDTSLTRVCAVLLVLGVGTGVAVLIDRLLARLPMPTQLGIAFGLAGAMQAIAVLVENSWASILALLFLGRGLALQIGGREYAARFTYPLLLIVFLFPLPFTWTSYAAVWLQDVVSKLSETLLGLFVVCTRTGHTIRIAGLDQSLVVAEECSGLRQILAFVACAAIFGALFHPRWLAHRVLLVLAAVPVAIFANVLRVVLMNLAAARFGTNWMTGWMHDIPALFSLPVGIGLFFLTDKLLFGAFGSPVAPAVPVPAASASGVPRRMLLAAGLTGILAAGNAGLVWHLSEAPPAFTDLTTPLGNTPMTYGEPPDAWVGRESVEYRATLLPKLTFDWTEVITRQYSHTARPVHVDLYMVYSRTGEDRKHHPEICIREVAGAPEDAAMRAKIVLDGAGRECQRFRFLTRADQSTVVYYWHYRLPMRTAERGPLQQLHQRLGRAAPSVTVQVSMSGHSLADLALVESTFLPALDRAVRATAPGETVVGHDRIPVSLVRY